MARIRTDVTDSTRPVSADQHVSANVLTRIKSGRSMRSTIASPDGVVNGLRRSLLMPLWTGPHWSPLLAPAKTIVAAAPRSWLHVRCSLTRLCSGAVDGLNLGGLGMGPDLL